MTDTFSVSPLPTILSPPEKVAAEYRIPVDPPLVLFEIINPPFKVLGPPFILKVEADEVAREPPAAVPNVKEGLVAFE